MPTGQRHHDQSCHNETMARQTVTAAPDWSVTMAFYAALHCVEEYGAVVGWHGGGHAARAERLARDPRLRTIARDYHDLRVWSERARYLCPPANDWIRDAGQVQTRAFSALSQIKRCVDKALRATQHT